MWQYLKYLFNFVSLDGDTEGEEGSQNKLEDMIKELSVALTGVKHEQEYMQVFFELYVITQQIWLSSSIPGSGWRGLRFESESYLRLNGT